MKDKLIPAFIVDSYAAAWAMVVIFAPYLWLVALLGFIQNVAFTFVSRGRNSGSLGYHFIAAIFSNGIYAALLFVSIDQVAQAKAQPLLFLTVYTLATLSGSIAAHWLALRLEKGKAKNVQDDKFAALQKRVDLNQETIDQLLILNDQQIRLNKIQEERIACLEGRLAVVSSWKMDGLAGVIKITAPDGSSWEMRDCRSIKFEMYNLPDTKGVELPLPFNVS